MTQIKTNATSFRWVVVALLFFISTVNYLDRSSMSYAIDSIAQVFALSPSQKGLILGAFSIGYVCTPFLAGLLVDRCGSRITLAVAAVAWSVTMGGMGLASGFAAFYLLRMSLGFCEGANLPINTRVINDWLSPRERVIAFSCTLVAVPIAMALGAPLITQLIIHLNWRGMFLVLGALGFLWLPLWLLFFRNTPQQSRYVNAAELNHIESDKLTPTISLYKKTSWKFLLTNPTLLVNNLAFFVSSYFHFFFMTWLPSFLAHEYHLNLKQIGIFSIAPWLVAALLLSFVGIFSDYLFKRTGRLRYARTYLIIASQLLAAINIIPLLFTHNVGMAIIFISLALGCSMSANAALYAINLDITRQRAGIASGIMVTFSGISGFLAPVLTGYVVEKTGTFNGAFILMLVIAAVSISLLCLFHHPDRIK